MEKDFLFKRRLCLLGIVIEKIAKIKFVDFMKQEVLGPSKMSRSGFFAFNDLPHNTALGYKKNTTQTNVYNLPIRGGGDGGMYTTCEDLENFWNGLFGFDILSPGLTKTFLETKHRFNEKMGMDAVSTSGVMILSLKLLVWTPVSDLSHHICRKKKIPSPF